MRNADALRAQRRSTSNSMQLVAIAGGTITILAVAVMLYLGTLS